jgi:hypothetical protein
MSERTLPCDSFMSDRAIAACHKLRCIKWGAQPTVCVRGDLPDQSYAVNLAARLRLVDAIRNMMCGATTPISFSLVHTRPGSDMRPSSPPSPYRLSALLVLVLVLGAASAQAAAQQHAARQSSVGCVPFQGSPATEGKCDPVIDFSNVYVAYAPLRSLCSFCRRFRFRSLSPPPPSV